MREIRLYYQISISFLELFFRENFFFSRSFLMKNYENDLHLYLDGKFTIVYLIKSITWGGGDNVGFRSELTVSKGYRGAAQFSDPRYYDVIIY